jgi:hypothetical protein
MAGLLVGAVAVGSGTWNVLEARQTDTWVEARLITEVPRPPAADTAFLQYPAGATRFADGTIAVADGMAPTIRFFDAAGNLKRTAGRSGEGPNEFVNLNWMGQCGDGTATVYDFSLMRFTSVDAAGRFVGQFPLRDRFDVPRPPAILSCSRNGYLVVLLRIGNERIPGREIDILTAPLYLLPPGGNATRILEATPVIQWINEEATYRAVSFTTEFAVSDSLVFVARTDSTVVRVYNFDGGLASTLTLDLPRRAATDLHVRRNAEELTAFLTDRAGRNGIVDRYMEMEHPDYLPYHNGLHLDPAGRLWVVLSFPGDPTTTLRAYTNRGAPVGEVRIAADLRVFEVGEDYVLGSLIDAETLEPKVALYGFEFDQ